MDLLGILSVTGKPGLFKNIAQAKNGLIIESLIDGRRTIVFADAQISALSDISIYTEDGDLPLKDVFVNLYKTLEGKATSFEPKKASKTELEELFGKAIPNYDKDKVYISNIKTAFTWYNLLLSKGLIDDKQEQENSENTKSETDNEITHHSRKKKD